MKKSTILILLIFALALTFGCTGGNKGANETKLDVEQGVGIVGNLKMDELHPGLEGYLSLDVRSNLEGEGASNVVIAIDNVNPFKIVECGTSNTPNIYRTCNGQLDKDQGLPVREHKTAKFIPGEEVNVFWRLKAPSKDEISDIALKHPIYHTISYDYNVMFHQNIVFMSQNEMIKRKQAGEDYIVSGESGNTAGELRFSSTTQQPIIYFFDYPPNSECTKNTWTAPTDNNKCESNFSFATQYLVENKGKGFPISDVVVLLEYPSSGIAVDNSTPEGAPEGMPNYQVYGWHKWKDFDSDECNTGESIKLCEKWVNNTLGDKIKSLNKDNLLIKRINSTDFVDSFSIYAPFVMTGAERTYLRNHNIPLKIYSFNVYVVYRYFTIGKDYITVYPVRGI